MKIRLRAVAVGLASALLLSACGGGDDRPPPALSCSIADQKTWLRSYMNDWYLWYASSPNPAPAAYPSVEAYFDALLYAGADPLFPYPDEWSYYQPTEAFERFYQDGETFGYGLFVAGVEVHGQPAEPLYVRYVEPRSPAARFGLQRGDRIVELNDAVVTNSDADFALLSPLQQGETLKVRYVRNGGAATVVIPAEVFRLKPLPELWRVAQNPGGRRIGYLMVKDMISQALDVTEDGVRRTPLADAFAAFRQAGVHDLVLDLRYNGGGLVSVARDIASYVSAGRTAGGTFARLLYNNRHADRNQDFRFGAPAQALQLTRVFVLMGPRTCSASEQVINGLRPWVDVIAIGDTTCGKPFGFLPQDDGCGRTYSVVNFESVNASNAGRYVFGFDATCRVAEDFTQPLGSAGDPLFAAAAFYADANACPAGTAWREQPQQLRPAGPRRSEPGERQDMIGR